MINLLFLDGDFWTSFIKGGIFGFAIAIMLSYLYKRNKKNKNQE